MLPCQACAELLVHKAHMQGHSLRGGGAHGSKSAGLSVQCRPHASACCRSVITRTLEHAGERAATSAGALRPPNQRRLPESAPSPASVRAGGDVVTGVVAVVAAAVEAVALVRQLPHGVGILQAQEPAGGGVRAQVCVCVCLCCLL